VASSHAKIFCGNWSIAMLPRDDTDDADGITFVPWILQRGHVVGTLVGSVAHAPSA